MEISDSFLERQAARFFNCITGRVYTSEGEVEISSEDWHKDHLCERL